MPGLSFPAAVSVRLRQCGRKPQDGPIFIDRIVKPALLLCLLSSAKVLLNLILVL